MDGVNNTQKILQDDGRVLPKLNVNPWSRQEVDPELNSMGTTTDVPTEPSVPVAHLEHVKRQHTRYKPEAVSSDLDPEIPTNVKPEPLTMLPATRAMPEMEQHQDDGRTRPKLLSDPAPGYANGLQA